MNRAEWKSTSFADYVVANLGILATAWALATLISTLVALRSQLEAAGQLKPEVEPAPEIYAFGPSQSGRTTEYYFSKAQDLQAYCNFFLGRPARGYYTGCYIPSFDLVVLPNAEAEPDFDTREALRAHEWAHARGWRHGADPARERQASRSTPTGSPPAPR